MTPNQLRQQAESRAANIAAWRYGIVAAPPPPAVSKDAPPADPTTPPTAGPTDAEIDAKVSEGLSQIGKLLDDVISAQKTDPGNADPSDPDAAVSADLVALKTAYDQAVADQNVDAQAGPDPAKDTPADPPKTDAKPPDAPPADPKAPPAKVAPNGDVPGQMACANCAHLASGHADVEAGANSGACAMEGCNCNGMVVPDDGEGDQPDPDALAAATDPTDAPDAPPVEGSPVAEDGSNLGLPPGVIEGPAFTIPVGVIEGTPTSDGREIAPGVLTWRDPPMPLMAMWENGPFGHDGAKVVGRIDSVTRSGNSIGCAGVFDTSPEGLDAARMVENGMFRGVSVDIGDTTEQITVSMDDDGMPDDEQMLLTSGQIMGWTITPFPAFEGCYIVTGDGSDGQKPIPAKPATEPTAEQVAASSYPAINIINFAECEPCQSELQIVASGGPMAPPTGWFTNPALTGPTPITVDDDGRVYGHIAAWGVCHTGISGTCTVAPRSQTDYASFRTGRVLTAEGDLIATGRLTMGTGHAEYRRRIAAADAMAHYDNTGTAVADVVAGEDEFGIWVAGSTRPGITDEQSYALRASPISGDWRKIGRGMELVAALCVNTPGFPIPMALAASALSVDGETTALVAVGAAEMQDLRPHDLVAPTPMTTMERALEPLLGLASSTLDARFAAAIA